MKSIIIKSIIFIILILTFGCNKSESIGPSLEGLDLKQISNLKVIPLQQVWLKADNELEGNKEDYTLFFDSTEILISELLNNEIEIIIPYEISQGLYKINLKYKGKDNEWGDIEILDRIDIFSANIAFFENNDDDYPIVVLDSINNIIVPHFVDGKINSINLTTENQEEIFIFLNEDGFPNYIHDEQITIVVEGYDFENFTVNVSYYFNNNPSEVFFEYGVQIDENLINFSIQNKKVLSKSWLELNQRYKDAINAIGIGLGGAACIVSGVSAIATGGFALPLAVLSCAGTVSSFVTLINPELEDEIETYMLASYGLGMSGFGCGKALITRNPNDLFNGIIDCTNIVLQGAATAVDFWDNYFAENQIELEQLKDILKTGVGDVKVTLTWDTNNTDIDLWVTDPLGNLIKWDQATSTSGGMLDLDDVDGFGPENIFWPTNESPLGTYTVQIHYYEPDDGPVTNCTVRINNFGQQSTYQQALTPNGLVTIAQFEAGNNGNNNKSSLGRKVKFYKSIKLKN